MKYSVMLRGENFEIKSENKINNMGFFTTRIVKANNLEEAESKAIDLIRKDDNLMNSLYSESILEAKVYMHEISKASWWKRTGGAGYTFWNMDTDEDG